MAWYDVSMLIIGNWKAYLDSPEKVKKVAAAAKRIAANVKSVELAVAPTAVHMTLLGLDKRSKLKLAAQDVSDTTGQALTGEVTAPALAALGASYVIVGHSERRTRGETDAVIAEKVKRVLAQGMTPVVCVGEHERDEEAQYLREVREQVASVLKDLNQKERLQVVVAYEPVWAIGKSGTEAVTPEDLEEMVLYLRKLLSDFLPGKASEKVRILYGGSVDATNARSLVAGTGVDGLLVGRASTDSKALGDLIKAVS